MQHAWYSHNEPTSGAAQRNRNGSILCSYERKTVLLPGQARLASPREWERCTHQHTHSFLLHTHTDPKASRTAPAASAGALVAKRHDFTNLLPGDSLPSDYGLYGTPPVLTVLVFRNRCGRGSEDCTLCSHPLTNPSASWSIHRSPTRAAEGQRAEVGGRK